MTFTKDLLTILLILSFSVISVAQDYVDLKASYHIARDFLENGELDSAESVLIPLISQMKNEEAYATDIHALYASSLYYKDDLKGAIVYFHKTDSLSASNLFIDHLQATHFYTLYSATHVKLEHWDEGQEIIQKGLDYYDTHNLDSLDYKGRMLMARGNAYFSQGKHSKALSSYTDAHKIFQEEYTELHWRHAFILTNIAAANNKLHNYKETIDLSLKSIEILKELYGETDVRLIKDYLNMSSSLIGMKQYEKAKWALEKGLEIGEIHEDKDRLASIHHNLSTLYLKITQLGKAEFHCHKSLGYRKESKSAVISTILTYNNLAKINEFQNRREDAINCLDSIVQICRTLLPKDHPYILMPLTNLMELYIANEEFDKAKKLIKEIEQFASKTLKPSSPSFSLVHKVKCKLAAKEKKWNLALEEINLMASKYGVDKWPSHDDREVANLDIRNTYLLLLAEFYFYKSEQTDSINDMKSALNHISELLDWYLYLMKRYHGNEKDEVFQISYNLSLERGTQLCYKLFQLTKEKEYIDMAITFIEWSKSHSIKHQLNLLDVSENKLIIEDYIWKEKKYAKTLVEYETKLFQLRKENTDQIQIDSMELATQKLREKQIDFLEEIEREFPIYYEIKYHQPKYSVEALQSRIAETWGIPILNYLAIEDKIYLIFVSADKYHFIEKEIDSHFYSKINNYLTGLENREPIKSLKSLNDSLFQIVFSNVSHLYPKGELIIIPSNNIGYLNFETLIDPNTNKYLIDKYIFYYLHSLNQLKTENNSRSLSTYVTFLPEYKSISIKNIESSDTIMSKLYSGTYPLNAFDESANLGNYMDGVAFKGVQATKQKFEHESTEYDIIHLSIHAVQNKQNPFKSSLLFSYKDSVLSNNILTLSEIYDLELDQSVVFLNGCNTARGNIIENEGIINFSHAFSSGGAAALGINLWSVPSEASFELFTSFYNSLSGTFKLSNKLRQEKLKFIENPRFEEYSHPFYWGGTVIYGSPESLSLKNKGSIKIWIWVSLFILFVFAFYFISKLK